MEKCFVVVCADGFYYGSGSVGGVFCFSGGHNSINLVVDV